MFLKDIRDNILSMHLIALSSSMKTSLSDFFFFHPEFFEVLFFLFCYVLDSLMLKNFNSWILRFFFWFIAVETRLFVCCVVWIEFKANAERVTKRMTAIRSKFRSTLGNKELVKKITLFLTFGFVYPPPWNNQQTCARQLNDRLTKLNYEFDYVPLSFAIELFLFELVGFPNVRLDISYILLHCSTSGDEMY